MLLHKHPCPFAIAQAKLQGGITISGYAPAFAIFDSGLLLKNIIMNGMKHNNI
jgi:hypothetical protein